MIGYIDTRKSPNFSSRHDTKIDTIIIHHTAGALNPSIDWLCNPQIDDPKRRVSAHFVIARNGDIYSLVNIENKAFHVGSSKWDYNGDGQFFDNEYSLNARSIGIELESNDNGYTNLQMGSLIVVCLNLVHIKSIPIKQILGHKEVSLIGKIDPSNFNMPTFRNAMEALRQVRPIAVLR